MCFDEKMKEGCTRLFGLAVFFEISNVEMKLEHCALSVMHEWRKKKQIELALEYVRVDFEWGYCFVYRLCVLFVFIAKEKSIALE